jgi:HEAT repeat protein
VTVRAGRTRGGNAARTGTATGLTSRWRRLAVFASLAALAWHDGEAPAVAAEPLYRGRPVEKWRLDLEAGPPMVRERAVVALCEADEAVPLLVGAIADQDFNVRTLAIFCLGRLGAKGKEAVPALVRTLEDRDWIVRRYAAAALGLLETTALESSPALARSAVEDTSPEVRQTAKFALGRMGPEARERVRAVLQQASVAGPDEAVKARAVDLLRDLDKR